MFAPNRILIAYAFNAPGAMHNSSIVVCGGVHRELEILFYGFGGRCVADSALAK